MQRAHLLSEFLARADDFVGRPHVVDLRALGALGLKQAIYSVERNATIIADNAAAAVGVGKAGNDGRLAALHDLGRISVENAVVVGLAILREGFVDLRIRLETSRLQSGLDHAQAAEWKDRPLERLIGLQPDDHFVVAIDIARFMRKDRRRRFRVDGKHALFPLRFEIRLQFRPNCFCAIWCSDEESLVSGVGRDVANDKVAHVDGPAPISHLEFSPTMIATKPFDIGLRIHDASPV